MVSVAMTYHWPRRMNWLFFLTRSMYDIFFVVSLLPMALNLSKTPAGGSIPL